MKFVKDDKREQRKLEALLKKIQKHSHVAVGILQDEPHDEHFSMVDLAMVHEYGSSDGHIPQRSFIRSTCDAKKEEHVKIMQKLQSKIVKGSITNHQALTQLGELVSKDMVQTINRRIAPPLEQSTIDSKRRRKNKKAGLTSPGTSVAKSKKKPRKSKKSEGKGFTPLIETGRLKGSITHEVRGGT